MTRPKLNEQEIERKLRSAKAPHPPSHLLDRLKADIPDQATLTSAHPERRPQRLWRNTWAVAASVLALVGMSYVMLRTMENAEVSQSAPMAARTMEPGTFDRAGRAQPVAKPTAPARSLSGAMKQVMATDSVSAPSSGFEELDAAPKRDRANEVESQGYRLDATKDQLQKAAGYDRREVAAGEAVGGVLAEGSPQDAPAARSSADAEDERLIVAQVEARPVTVTAPAPAAPPPPQAEPPAEAVSAPAGAALGAANSRLARKKEAKTAGGGQFVDAAADPVSTFGLVVRDDSWGAIRTALNRGSLPAANVVREEEVINHFDYRDEASRSDVTLFAEAAPAAFGEAGLYVLRVAVHSEAPLRGAAAQLEFNPEIVRSYRLVGYQTAEGGGESVTRTDLPKGASVSAVYELRLERRPSARQQLGVMRLKWEGRESSLQINGSDVAGTWNASLPSLRLATLAAKWAEMLKGSPFAAAIAPRDLMTRVQQLGGELAGDAEVAEFVGLVGRSVRLLE